MKRSARPSGARTEVVVAFYLALAITAFFWHGASQGDNDIWRSGAAEALWLWAGPLLGIGIGGLAVTGMRLMDRPDRWAWMQSLEQEFGDILGSITRREVLILALASSVAEELFFRGAMMDAWGIVASSVLFALVHVPPRRELWPWTAMAGAFGLSLALLTVWTGNLGAAVAVHFTVNALNLGRIARRGTESRT